MNVVIDDVLYVPAPRVSDKPALLGLRFECADIGRNVSIREYLYELLATLWNEGEGFSGKRPFGNSGWERDLYAPLIAAGAVTGQLDAEGYVNHVDRKAANQLVMDLIGPLCALPTSGADEEHF